MRYGWDCLCDQPAAKATAKQAEYAARHRAERGDLEIMAALVALLSIGPFDAVTDFGNEVASSKCASAARIRERYFDEFDEAELRKRAHAASIVGGFGDCPCSGAVFAVDYSFEFLEVGI